MSQHRNGNHSLSGPESVMEWNIDCTGVQMRERERQRHTQRERERETERETETDREGERESDLHQTEARGIQPWFSFPRDC